MNPTRRAILRAQAQEELDRATSQRVVEEVKSVVFPSLDVEIKEEQEKPLVKNEELPEVPKLNSSIEDDSAVETPVEEATAPTNNQSTEDAATEVDTKKKKKKK